MEGETATGLTDNESAFTLGSLVSGAFDLAGKVLPSYFESQGNGATSTAVNTATPSSIGTATAVDSSGNLGTSIKVGTVLLAVAAAVGLYFLLRKS